MKQLITIQTWNGEQDVEAEVIGLWAVHPAVYEAELDGYFAITHLPSGFRAGAYLSEQEALAYAAQYEERCTHDDHDALIAFAHAFRESNGEVDHQSPIYEVAVGIAARLKSPKRPLGRK